MEPVNSNLPVLHSVWGIWGYGFSARKLYSLCAAAQLTCFGAQLISAQKGFYSPWLGARIKYCSWAHCYDRRKRKIELGL